MKDFFAVLVKSLHVFFHNIIVLLISFFAYLYSWLFVHKTAYICSLVDFFFFPLESFDKLLCEQIEFSNCFRISSKAKPINFMLFTLCIHRRLPFIDFVYSIRSDKNKTIQNHTKCNTSNEPKCSMKNFHRRFILRGRNLVVFIRSLNISWSSPEPQIDR